MRKYLSIYTIIFLSLFTQGQIKAQGIEFLEDQEWETILDMAKAQDKYIFMDCYTTWCGPCKLLASKVFPVKEVGDFFNEHFINVKYDMEKGVGLELSKTYKENIVGYPTLLLIDKTGKVIHQMAGYQESDALIEGMKSGMEGKNLPAMREKYSAGIKDLDFMEEYAELLEAAYIKNEKKKIIEEYIQTLDLEQLLDPRTWNLVGSYINDPYSPQFEFIVFNFDKLVYLAKADGYKLEHQIMTGIENAVEKIIYPVKNEDKTYSPLTENKENINLINRFLDRGNFRRTETMRALLAIHQLKLENRWEEAFIALKNFSDIKALGYTNKYLNESIKYLVQNSNDKKLLKKALELVSTVQNKENSKENGSNYHDTIAQLYAKLGDKKKAEYHTNIYEEKVKEFQEKNKDFLRLLGQ